MREPTDESLDLWKRVTSYEALQAAWYKVNANEGGPGGDAVHLADFRADLFSNLTQLRAELLGGTYRSGPFRKVSVPKKKPGYRILTIPTVRDRVVHTSIANALNPILEPLFEDGSFAYRPGRGVVHAVQRIEAWHRRGFDIVIEADIVSYFDNIDQAILQEKLAAAINPLPGAAPLLALVAGILEDQAGALGTVGQGLVQGSPLSPLLANLYLDALDEEIDSQGVKIVRFADDFVILCKSEKKARKVLEHCVRILAEHNLRLHDEGTRIVNFDRGFDFIGYLFLRTLALKEKRDGDERPRKPVKSHVSDEGIIELEDKGSRFDPGKRVLYVLDPSHSLSIRNRSFSVAREDGSELIAIPHQRVGRIEVGPDTDFGRRPIDLAMDAGIEFALIDSFGQTKGIATSHGGKRATRQFAQAKAILHAGLRIPVAKLLLEARIRNQRTQLLRLCRDRESDGAGTALLFLQRSLRKIDALATVEELLGTEGAATAAYWPALGSLVEGRNLEPFRRSRPATDPLNATINYLTGILERDTRAAIQSVGLHPGFGFLHASTDRHDGLIYDLMEPFRAALTEGLAVYLFNARRLRSEMFLEESARPIELSAEARQAIIRGYESAAAKRVNRPDGGGKLSWRAMMRHQAQSLVHAVLQENAADFTPYLMEA